MLSPVAHLSNSQMQLRVCEFFRFGDRDTILRIELLKVG
jgi:hypothetical protein